MSEVQQSTAATAEAPAPNPSSPGKGKPNHNRGPSIHQIYALPAPIRTFPLPTFYPNNPISLLHFGWAWLKQTWNPPPAEPSIVHQGVWSETTCSVHITDEKATRALWEQGFFGKGSLSRSEPNWLKRELVRKGNQDSFVSEIHTNKRREERAEAKWERARLEQEAIRQTKAEEAVRAEQREKAAAAQKILNICPIGPAELLALPNSASELASLSATAYPSLPATSSTENGSATGLSLIEQLVGDPGDVNVIVQENGTTIKHDHPEMNGIPAVLQMFDKPATPIAPSISSESSGLSSNEQTPKRRKSVRFSPTVESATFELSDPPSPSAAAAKGLRVQVNGSTKTVVDVINREHLQLTPEESFFLTFGLGTLAVTDPYSGQTLSTQELLKLFRQHSHAPARTGPDDDLFPDDNFLVHYVVYHHFRSLGWVPRPGIKFAVDWLLYAKGPVFDHAEFGIVVIPSYTDPWWKESGLAKPTRSWSWMHSVVRVLSHATKSLVLVYVDVPTPAEFDAALQTGVSEALKLYKVREVMVKRWSSNRNR